MDSQVHPLTDAGPAGIVTNPEGRSPIVLICEHASARIPKVLGSLGLSEASLASHIAWDPGAEPVSRRLAEILDATLVSQRYSRLVYDCNRPPQSDEAISLVSERTEIPGNQGLNAEQRTARFAEIHAPFHARISALVERKLAQGERPLIVSVHSFTPVYKGRRRTVQLGVLHGDDSRLGDAILENTQCVRHLVVRRNEPYGPDDGVIHTLGLHSSRHGLLNVMFEIRNDLIAEPISQNEWAALLAELLTAAMAQRTGAAEPVSAC